MRMENRRTSGSVVRMENRRTSGGEVRMVNRRTCSYCVTVHSAAQSTGAVLMYHITSTHIHISTYTLCNKIAIVRRTLHFN